MRKSDDRKNEAIARLLKTVAPGDTVYSILRHTSRSGLQREISLVAVDRLAVVSFPEWDESREAVVAAVAREALTALDYWVVHGFGYRIGKHGGIVVGGGGMDMGFHLVYNLGRRLWPNGTDKPHGKRNGQPDSDGGYALKHRWL